ncbi:MAG TPA: hypothetical protein VIM62_10755 [Acidobacteriaceae bacterium]
MKIAIRVIALTAVFAAFVAGSSMPKNSAMASMQRSDMPGPIPLCNPLTQSCPNIRGK